MRALFAVCLWALAMVVFGCGDTDDCMSACVSPQHSEGWCKDEKSRVGAGGPGQGFDGEMERGPEGDLLGVKDGDEIEQGVQPRSGVLPLPGRVVRQGRAPVGKHGAFLHPGL
jgi:hypothetical protein